MTPPLAYARPRSTEEAAALAGDARFSLPMFKAGAIDIMDHLKEGLADPDLLIDVRAVTRPDPLFAWDDSFQHARTIRIAAGATLAEVAASPLIRENAPALADAAASAATPQIRNVATVAGNLLQRPRCWYYRSSLFNCLKKGGGQCFAFDGENKFHAIFGDGPCHIVHPSNLAPPLQAMSATVGLNTGAPLPIHRLYHTPDQGVRTEHNLRPDQLITHVNIVPSKTSGFYAIKEKQSFDWPLVFAAVNITLTGDIISAAGVIAGAVAPIPWPLPEVDHLLTGTSINDDRAIRDACAIAVEGASPLAQNEYKLTLLPVAIRRAILKAAGRTPEDLFS